MRGEGSREVGSRAGLGGGAPSREGAPGGSARVCLGSSGGLLASYRGQLLGLRLLPRPPSPKLWKEGKDLKVAHRQQSRKDRRSG